LDNKVIVSIDARL